MQFLRTLRPSWRWAVALLVVGFGLRVARLGDKNVWYDEGFSVFMARQDLVDLPRETALDVHPPVYFALLHGWRQLTGDSEYALRYLSVLFSVLILALGFRLTRGLAGDRAAVLATALLAIHRASVWYSQEIRMYALTMLCALLALSCVLAWVRRGGWRPLAGYVVAVAAGLHTLYLFALTPVALNLAVLGLLLRRGRRTRRRDVIAWVVAQALAGLSLVPWLIFAIPLKPERFTDGAPVGLLEVVGLWLNTWLVGTALDIWNDTAIYVFGAGVIALALAVTWRNRSRISDASWLFTVATAGGAVATVGLIWALNLPWRFQLTFSPTPRYLITLVPWAVLALGLALDAIIARWRRIGLGLSAVMLATLAAVLPGYYADRVLYDTFRSAALTLKAYQHPADGLLLHNDREWPIIDYYLGGQAHGNVPSAMYIGDDATAAGQAEALWEEHDAVWLLLTRESLLNDYDQRIQRWLADRAVASRTWDYGPNARLWLFARTPERAATLTKLAGDPTGSSAIPIAPGLELLRVDCALTEVQVGETLRVFFYWRVNTESASRTFGLRLSSLFGGTADEIPLSVDATTGLVRQQVDFPIRPYVGAGPYRLQLTTGLGGDVLVPDLLSLNVAAAAALPASASALTTPAEFYFQNGASIRGWQAEPGALRLQVTIEWEVTRLIDRRLKQFWHLVGPEPSGERRAQVDAEPLGGVPAMTAWPLGARARDRITLDLPAELAPGRYTILTGLYDPITGERVPVITSTGAVLGDTVTLGTVDLP